MEEWRGSFQGKEATNHNRNTKGSHKEVTSIFSDKSTPETHVYSGVWILFVGVESAP